MRHTTRVLRWGCTLALAGAAHAAELGDASLPSDVTVRSEHTTGLVLSLDVQAGGGARTVPLDKHHEQRSTLAWRDGGVEVGWTVNHQRDRGPDGARGFDLPVAGHSYRLAGEPLRVEGTVAAAEAEIARSAADLPALLTGVRAMLGEGELAVGVKVSAGQLFAGLVRDAPGEPTVGGDLTLREVREQAGQQVAVYAVRVELDSEGSLEPGVTASMHATLSGELWVEVATGWTVRLTVRGPVRFAGRGSRWGQTGSFEGVGTFESDTRLGFEVGEVVRSGLMDVGSPLSAPD